MSTPATEGPDSTPANPHGTTLGAKYIICCFDGTGNQFGENSNVVRFLDTLVRDKPEKQVVYYQPGIGTYSEHAYYTTTISQLFSLLDECLALFLDNHVKDGYRFIMQHYKPGDKICLFGFSRGAYIARVLMGMLYKVGLLPPDNIQQVDFAFSIYKMTGDKGRELSREFKKTFAFPITVEFVGVWDTVASVGITPTPVSRHPYTSVDYATKYFRHALALDERRVRFQPQTWNTGTTDREQELDVDEPSFPTRNATNKNDYIPPDRDVADVKEVWFAGCHADVGGGSHHGRFQHSLSYIPFRWMISEARVNTGILFDDAHLSSHNVFDPRKRPDYVSQRNESDKEAIELALKKLFQIPADKKLPSRLESSLGDIDAPIYDQLSTLKAWWALELLPLLTTYQTMTGNWLTERRRNLGDGRRVPFHCDEMRVLVHTSVRIRLAVDQRYKPAALNWKSLYDAGMIQWVDDFDYKDPRRMFRSFSVLGIISFKMLGVVQEGLKIEDCIAEATERRKTEEERLKEAKERLKEVEERSMNEEALKEAQNHVEEVTKRITELSHRIEEMNARSSEMRKHFEETEKEDGFET